MTLDEIKTLERGTSVKIKSRSGIYFAMVV